MTTFIVLAVEDDTSTVYNVGECEEMLEATFLARDEFVENPATRAVAVVKAGNIIYVIGRLEGSGYIAHRDGTPIETVDEALRLIRPARS